MTTFQYVTIDDLYAKVVDDLSTSPKDELRILNWIGESCEFIYTNSVLVKYREEIFVKDYVVKAPCNVTDLEGLFINGVRIHHVSETPLNYNNETTNVRIIDNNDIIIDETTEVEKLFRSKEVNRYTKSTNNTINNKGLTYNKRGQHLHFNFSSGQVEIHYKGLLKNSNNQILYPDQIDYKECIVHWVWYKAILAGILKGNMGDALSIHKDFKIKAIGNIEFPSPEEMQEMVNKQSAFGITNNYDIIV